MKHLIIYAHPNPNSFNHAILETTVNTLKTKGHEVVVRDLYAINFQPVLKQEELNYLLAGQTPEDIKTEQEYITQADVITLIYPVWWAGPPAILKGYLDRVLAEGFAYGSDESDSIKKLTGKKGFIISTYGAPEDIYEETGMNKGFQVISDVGIFDFVGIEPIEHLFFGSIGFLEEEAYKDILKKVENTIHSHFSI